VSAAVPGLLGEQVVRDTAEECAARLADALAEDLRRRLKSLPRVHVALSGGASGKILAAALAAKRDVTAAEWARMHLWMVDERCVGPDDSRLNFASLRDALLQRTPIPMGNLHPMPVLESDGAERYEGELRAALAERTERDRGLDAVVLGMGADGHTASLFPGAAALEERERWIVFSDGEQVTPPRPRMTMTFRLLNQTRFIALFVAGESKREALRRVAAQREDYRTLPVAGVAPVAGGRMVWFLDRAALP
jgi:6-phosphogluconolactonase